ncbi:MAG: hypothetical protein AAF938_01555 [Myxococcota bacterium]
MNRAVLALALVGCAAQTMNAPRTLPSEERLPLRIAVERGPIVRLTLSGGPGCVQDETGEHCSRPGVPARWQRSWRSFGTALDGGFVVSDQEPRYEGVETQVDQQMHRLPLADGLEFVSSAPLVEEAPGLWRTAAATEGADARRRLLQSLGPVEGPVLIAADHSEAPRVVRAGDAGAFLRAAYFADLGEGPGFRGAAAFLLEEAPSSVEESTFLARYLRDRRALSGEPAYARGEDAGWLSAFCMPPEPSRRGALRAALQLRRAPDPDACLRPHGHRLAIIRFEHAPSAWLLRVGEVNEETATIVLGRGFFERGDRVVEVNGGPVERGEDIAWHVRDLPTGRRFNVWVQRGDRRLRTWVRRARRGEAQAIRFTLQPRE